ncbi:redoxin domain-containing protein [Candidatus Dependentiae bacterium]|nr:redoxin domain-containing protein [Candidatus Dependentiae bacterium]
MHKNKELVSTALHQAITQQNRWLNLARPLTPQDLQGRIILLDFWTFCCINCIHIIPELHKLEKEFGNALTIIGVHSAKFTNEKDQETIKAAIIKYGIEHPVINDSDFHLWNLFGIRGWPTLILLNPKGRIEEVYGGEGHTQELQQAIQSLIKQYGDRINTTPLPLELEATKQSPHSLNFPSKLEYVPNFDGQPLLFISDSSNNRILGVRPSGELSLSIGSGISGADDGSFNQTQFNKPQGILYNSGALYIADTNNHLLRVADFKTGQVTTLAGTGQQGSYILHGKLHARSASLSSPWDLSFYPTDKEITIAMAGTHQLWIYNLETQMLSIRAGNGQESMVDGFYPVNTLSQPSGLSAQKSKLYFVDSETSSLRVLDDKNITTLIGTGLFDFGYTEGTKATALMQHPLGLEADANIIYIADSYNHAIRCYDIQTERLTNYSGTGQRGSSVGPLLQTQYNEPNDIVKADTLLYIADTNNHRIIVLDTQTQNTKELTIYTSSALDPVTCSNCTI